MDACYFLFVELAVLERGINAAHPQKWMKPRLSSLIRVF